MLYGNFKNTTFTQSTYNCNAAVGFFMALIMRNFYPTALLADWYWYLIGMILFSIPFMFLVIKIENIITNKYIDIFRLINFEFFII